MKPDVTLITAYRDSPVRVPLFERWIKKQTFKGTVQWIVVDDGEVPAPLTMNQQHIRREHQGSEPDHTLGLNMREAFRHVESDFVLFIESDDYYGSNYVDLMHEALSKGSLIAGTSHAIKYNVRDRRHWRNNNQTHSSLCSTGIHRSLIPSCSMLCLSHNPFIDLELWKRHGSRGVLVPSLTPSWWPICIGIKCLPGLTSTETMNGRISRMPKASNGHPDFDLSKLRALIGDDADHYAEFGAAGN